ncbi:hypothetical protein ACEQ8H_006560 [Pleosporales sp. CAS-2024a]
MPLRSGKNFRKGHDPYSTGKGEYSHSGKSEQNQQVKGTKRARFPSDGESEPVLQKEVVKKRRKRAPRSAGHASETQAAEVIDLTRDDIPDDGMTRTGQGSTFSSTNRSIPSAFPDKLLGGTVKRDRHKQGSEMDAQSKGARTAASIGKAARETKAELATLRVQPAAIMFTTSEAIRLVDRHEQGILSSHKPPHTLRTGEYVPFPDTKSYHLGAMGKFEKNLLQTPKVDPSQPRNMRLKNFPPKAPRSTVRAATYVFDWGKHLGKFMMFLAAILLQFLRPHAFFSSWKKGVDFRRR